MSQSYQNSPLPRKLVQSSFHWLYAFWKFSRPHTIIGTSLSVLALYLIAIAISNPTSPLPFDYAHGKPTPDSHSTTLTASLLPL
ncbi:MAG: hypothetical protein ACYT04_84500, partial [Nostoc sp.]